MSAAIKPEQRLIDPHEVSHLWHEFDDAVRCHGRADQLGLIDRQNDPRGVAVQDDPNGWPKVMAMTVRIARTQARFGIHALDHGESSVCHMSQNRDWTKQ